MQLHFGTLLIPQTMLIIYGSNGESSHPVSNGDSSFQVCLSSFRNGVEMQKIKEWKVKIPDLSLSDHKGPSQLS